MRGDRRKATATHGRDDCAFRFHTVPRLTIVGGRDQMLVAGPNLERERALAPSGSIVSGSNR